MTAIKKAIKFSNATLLFNSAKYLTIFFYFVYSVLPSIYVLISIKLEEPVFFWLHLETTVQTNLAIYQILGFFVLLTTLPKCPKNIIEGNLNIQVPIIIIKTITILLFIVTLPAFFEMLIKSRSVAGRVDLFALSAVIADRYKLKIVFLMLSIFVTYLVFIKKKLIYLLYMVPIVSIEFISMGRVWPFAFFSVFLIGYLHVKNKFFSRKGLVFCCVFFGLYSMLRLLGQGADLNFLDSTIFLFGESFNTQQSIEIALSASNKLTVFEGIANVLAEFLPFGIKYLIIDPDTTAVNIIDNSKEALYGFTDMGFGSSWVSQFILYFGNNIFFAFYPLMLSLSMRLYLALYRKSGMFSFFYLYFYISGLFMFFRYGLNLSITYPLINCFYCLLIFLILKAFFEISSKSSATL